MNKKLFLLATCSCLLLAPQLHGLGKLINSEQPSQPTSFTAKDVKSDTALNQSIKDALAADLQAKGVTAFTHDGVVTLSGSVDNAKAKADIQSKVQAIPGVNKVVNNIEVTAAADAQQR